MLCVCFASIDHSEIILLRKNSDSLLKVDNTELLGTLLFGGVTWFVTFCPNSATDSGRVLRSSHSRTRTLYRTQDPISADMMPSACKMACTSNFYETLFSAPQNNT